MVTETEALMAALAPLVPTILAFLRKGKDTNTHGDSFLTMLKADANTYEKVAKVLPRLEPYVEQYKEVIEDAEKVWNSSGFTASEIARLETKAMLIQIQMDAAISKYRALKSDET